MGSQPGSWFASTHTDTYTQRGLLGLDTGQAWDEWLTGDSME